MSHTDVTSLTGQELAHLPLDHQLEAFKAILRKNESLMRVLKGAAELNLPNWYLAAGAVTQTIWNHTCSFPPEHGISDYDIIYHDGSDLSYDAENEAIQKGAAIFRNLASRVEIRNQARVHIWYEAKFGIPCPRYGSTEEGIDCFTSNTAMIGVRVKKREMSSEVRGQNGKAAEEKEDDWDWEIYAPVGLSDMFRRIVRPNPVVASVDAYERKVARWAKVWPGLTVHPWPERKVTKHDV